jgi:glycosyltransferase involved in cell wall biosynthesis
MNVLQIVATPKSAITTMANGIQRYNPDPSVKIKMAYFHPKRPDVKDIANVKKLMEWADLVDIQYWKSGSKVRECLPDMWNKKPKILTHYNPYNLHEEKWEDYKEIIVVNNYQKSELPKAHLFPLCINLDFFKPIKIYTTDLTVHMSVSRIEGKKGVEEVAEACNRLGYKFLLIGRISDPKYVERIKQKGGSSLVFHHDVTDERLRESYWESAIHVCNSVDNFESGTLPVLEAMACGVPVLSRRVGHVPDLDNGNNVRFFEGQQHEVDSLCVALKDFMDDRRERTKIRIAALESIKSRDERVRSKQYIDLYKAVK